jgi:ribosomal protein L37AE/L43A
MITNMACPKCGGQASEYDDHKWSCLKCGNKFVFTPESPSQTYVQSTVNIHGQATYELDVKNAIPAVTKSMKRLAVEPDYFREAYTEQCNVISKLRAAIMKDKVYKIVWLCASILFGLFAVIAIWEVLVIIFRSTDDGQDHTDALAMCFVTGVPALICLLFWFNKRRVIRIAETQQQAWGRSKATLEMQKTEDVTVGSYILCPHCETVYEYVEINKAGIEGLKHCLGCGKQFFTTRGYSYPVIFK